MSLIEEMMEFRGKNIFYKEIGIKGVIVLDAAVGFNVLLDSDININDTSTITHISWHTDKNDAIEAAVMLAIKLENESKQ